MLETMNRSGMRPSSRIMAGLEVGVPLLQDDAGLVESRRRPMAEPTARTPAGAIRVSAKMNGSIRVR